MNINAILKIVIGLILILVAVYSIIVWWLADFLVLLKGGIPVLVFLIGIVFLLLGFED
ncbi:hypothetical protein J4216_00880 [Candidatus Woesearchaeota archaeon]|nr:hypothetical protein [Candidatus Woesearchaeota archaeon]